MIRDMDFLKTITGKIASGVVAVAVVAAGISWWRMSEAERHQIVSGIGKILGWFGVVLFMPWIIFAVIARVARMESNAAGGALVAILTLIEVLLLLWLFGWHVTGATGWTFVIAGVLIAAVYNLLACDWIAEKVS
jgi:hypothetical protein